jgi:hypothetical protein
MRLGGPQRRSGRVRKISPALTGNRSLDLPSRSESLYLLRYPGRSKNVGTTHENRPRPLVFKFFRINFLRKNQKVGYFLIASLNKPATSTKTKTGYSLRVQPAYFRSQNICSESNSRTSKKQVLHQVDEHDASEFGTHQRNERVFLQQRRQTVQNV